MFVWKSPLASAATEKTEPTQPSVRDEADSGESKERPDGADQFYRLSLLQPAACYACPDRVLASIRIRTSDSRILNADGEILSDSDLLRLTLPAKGIWQLSISPEYLARLNLPARYYFTIDYLTAKGKRSLPTKPLKPIRPLAIPIPQVKVRIFELSDSDQAPKKDRQQETEKAWILKWKPVLETIRHAVRADGKPIEARVAYGLQLFYLDDNRREQPLHRELLYEGRYAIFDFRGTLYARLVDRLGNQSPRVALYAENENSPDGKSSTTITNGKKDVSLKK